MAKGGNRMSQSDNPDWDCDEEVAHCFTLFSATLFFFAGGTMCLFAALFLFEGVDTFTPPGFHFFDLELIQWAMFLAGILIAVSAQIGMVTAACAKCAANPDGNNDECEKCCTTVISTVYIIILSIIIAASICIAGGLTYYFVVLESAASDDCPYPQGSGRLFVKSTDDTNNAPEESTCPIDYTVFNQLMGDDEATPAAWYKTQQDSLTCGYFCDNGDYCSPSLGADYDVQTTGPYCTQDVTDLQPQTTFTVYQGTNLDGVTNSYRTGEPSTMPFRPTLFSVLDTFLLPFLCIWWIICAFSILLIVAAAIMCMRKENRKATYRTRRNPSDSIGNNRL